MRLKLKKITKYIKYKILVRQFKLGSKLIQQSLKMAKSKGAEFYFVHAVSSFARKIFEKYGFESIKSVSYQDYFKNDQEVLERLDKNHEAAFFMIKKL